MKENTYVARLVSLVRLDNSIEGFLNELGSSVDFHLGRLDRFDKVKTENGKGKSSAIS